MRLPDDLDFFGRDTSNRAEVETVLGALGPDLAQVFFDHLEVWDRENGQIVDELADPQLLDRDRYDFVVRLCYRIVWIEEEDRADHWVDFPKTSDPDVDVVDRVRLGAVVDALGGTLGGIPVPVAALSAQIIHYGLRRLCKGVLSGEMSDTTFRTHI